MRLRSVWARLRNETGDGDPILTIAGMVVTGIISSAVIGTIILVITLGANYVSENVTASNLASARKSWSQDANNASYVQVKNDTEVTFVELPHRSPGVYIKRPGQESDICRVSTWVLDDGTLTNRVEKYDPDDCTATGTITGEPAEVLPLYHFSGIEPGTRIVAYNTAGRDLRFDSDGVEIGLAENSPAPSTAEKAAWWRDYEWASTSVRRINIVGDIRMPLSGEAPTAIVGSTWINASRQGDTLDEAEPEPDVTKYNPTLDMNDVHVSRSSTVGKVVAFVREGIDIDLSSVVGASCGPYSTEYRLRWLPAHPDAPVKEATFTAFGPPKQPVSFDEVMNGLAGSLETTVACPTSVSDGPVTKTKAYTQPLPNPVLDGEIPDPGQPHQHQLTWTQTSTLPLTYNLIVSIDGGDPIPATDPETIPDLGYVKAWNQGSTYGRSYLYTVTATLDGGATSDPSNEVLLYTPWPEVPTPPVTITPQGPEVIDVDAGGSDAWCPAGTHMEWRYAIQIDEAGWQGWSEWGTTQHWTLPSEEGRRHEVRVEARCATAPDHHSDPSDPGVSDPWDEPITTVVTPPVTHTDPPGEDDPIDYSYATPDACPAFSWPEYRVRYALNADSTAVPPAYGPWSEWTTTPETTITVRYGERILVEVQARCISDYVEGPPTSTEDPWVRPIPAPPSAAPVLTSDAGGGSAYKDDRLVWTAVTCWDGTTPAYAPQQKNRNTGLDVYGVQETLSRALNTRPGEHFVFTVEAFCRTIYTNGARIASNQTSWTTPIAAPSAPSVYTTGTRRAGSGHNVYGQGSVCEPGTLGVIYQVRVEASGWQSQGYVTYQPQGNRTYQARAACDGIDLDSGWTEGPNAILYVDIPLPPAAPDMSGASANYFRVCSGGFSGVVRWGASSGATSYTVQYTFRSDGGTTVTRTVTTSGLSYTIYEPASGSSVGLEYRVRANGPGGSSAYAAGPAASTTGVCQEI